MNTPEKNVMSSKFSISFLRRYAVRGEVGEDVCKCVPRTMSKLVFSYVWFCDPNFLLHPLRKRNGVEGGFEVFLYSVTLPALNVVMFFSAFRNEHFRSTAF